MKQLAREVKSARTHPTHVEMSPGGSHQSMGGIERANSTLTGIIRAVKTHIGRETKRPMRVDHPIMPWLVRHSAWLVTRFSVRKSGRTAFEILKQRKFGGEVVCCGEVVWARKPGERDHTAKLDPMWLEKVWIGKAEASDEHLCADGSGVSRHRTIRRQPPAARWRTMFLDMVCGVPWELRPGARRPPSAPNILFAGVPPAPASTTPAASSASSAPPPPSGADDAEAAEQAAGSLFEDREKKERRTSVTEALIERYGRTPGCPRCEGSNRAHSDACRQRVETSQIAGQMAQNIEGDVARGKPAPPVEDHPMIDVAPQQMQEPKS